MTANFVWGSVTLTGSLQNLSFPIVSCPMTVPILLNLKIAAITSPAEKERIRGTGEFFAWASRDSEWVWYWGNFYRSKIYFDRGVLIK